MCLVIRCTRKVIRASAASLQPCDGPGRRRARGPVVVGNRCGEGMWTALLSGWRAMRTVDVLIREILENSHAA